MPEYGVPTDKQLEKINKLAKKPLQKEEVFVFQDKLVGDMIIPNRYIKIHKTALEDFKRDAITGVPLLLDHSWMPDGILGLGGRPKMAIPYGRTFNGVIRKGDAEGEDWALYADTYLIRGMEIDGISTDSLIQGVESGTFSDSSIGWSTERLECSICGEDIRGCEHYPGEEYEGELCYSVARRPASLWENSLVFSGAYPTAGILSSFGGKEVELAEMDDIKSSDPGSLVYCLYDKRGVMTFQKRKKDNLIINLQGVKTKDDLTQLVQSLIPMKGGDNLDIEKIVLQSTTSGHTVDYKWDSTGFTDGVYTITTNKFIADSAPEVFISKEEVQKRIGDLSAEEVLKLAEEGKAYRDELINDALEWGVRAMGNDFPKESWKEMLSEPGRSIQAIKDFRDGFKRQTDDAIPAGRATATGNKPDDGIPDEAFKV